MGDDAPGEEELGAAMPAIWFKPYTPDEANARGKDSMLQALGIELVEIGEDYLKARMPVDARTRQPGGVLHGGASVALAETLASWAATMVTDPARQYCVGLEINANHVRAVAQGHVTGASRPDDPDLGNPRRERGGQACVRVALHHGRARPAERIFEKEARVTRPHASTGSA